MTKLNELLGTPRRQRRLILRELAIRWLVRDRSQYIDRVRHCP
jgi:hypothetical protein